MTVNYANRGQPFENLLDYTNAIYERKGIALINKRPTPVKVLRARGNRVLSGVYDRKSTVDYDGFYKGYGIAFEAKSTKLPRLNLSAVTDHQIRYLKNAEKHGAVSFLIIDLRRLDEVYVLSNQTLQEYVKNAKKGGRKSIPIDDIQERGIKVKSNNGIPLDYLKAVDEMLGVAHWIDPIS